ncbi:MAG: MBL fold metallo-hydrolase, partial [Clostridiales bacterium]|nr:MBL fold metallo-hydrolase [Clostridiales bacterium]
HNHVQSLSGSPEVIRDGAPRELKGLRIYGVDSFHDDSGGSKRGKNVMFVVEGDGLRVAHLGDLGHPLDESQVALLGELDVLLVPIGGTYTITTPEAVELIRAVKPHTAIAMHFKTVLCGFAVTDEREFVRLARAKYLPNTLEITRETLGELPAAGVMLCPPAR